MSAKVTEAHRTKANLAVCGGCFPGPHHVHTRDRVARALADAEAAERADMMRFCLDQVHGGHINAALSEPQRRVVDQLIINIRAAIRARGQS